MAPQKRVKDELEKGSQFASERSSAEREVNVHRSNIEKFTQRLDDARSGAAHRMVWDEECLDSLRAVVVEACGASAVDVARCAWIAIFQLRRG